ncbi:hypothetical protein AHAS_Ahas02G0094600 [Arachis hypogaea]
MEESSISIKILPLDLMSTIIKCKLEPSNVASEVAKNIAIMILENCKFVIVLTTSISILMGRIIARSSLQKSKSIELPKCIIEKEPEPKVNKARRRLASSSVHKPVLATADDSKAIAEEANAEYNEPKT